MSDAHHEESAIKTPKQLILAVTAGFLVPIVAIVLLVMFVTNDQQIGAGSDNSPAAIEKRIRPVADDGFTLKEENAPQALRSGDEIYKMACAMCHGTGVNGAPKLGDAAAWKERVAQGYDTLVKHAIEGLRLMPAKGGHPDLDDIEVARAVVVMANNAGASFTEPQPAAAPEEPAKQ
ncbi:hypothetical protein GCM10007205_21150 [Oxalicibacterium flavum]|uniref:Cytochrome c domain-containing protein n=1 Tax=Oxalicibacterium flavum TaxID=179467 RepID=A0A8J2UNC5_9BURK|nr:c-type cytochrome [Oxalicibacterium flavum]GGC11785.1 hypothetical protein GCM10007205_21150 [Oxalicibacterium flavum]